MSAPGAAIGRQNGGFRHPTSREVALEKLAGLASGLGVEQQLDTAITALDILTGDWTLRPVPAQPLWRSDISDDGTPFEFSVAFGGEHPELRLLAEAQDAAFEDGASWQSGIAAQRRLVERFDVDLSRLNLVLPMFAPRVRCRRTFSLWHGAVLPVGSAPEFKVYLNPRVNGIKHAWPLTQRAFGELGLPRAWDWVSRFVPHGYQPLYFSLDLCRGPRARTKVYLVKTGADAQQLEDVLHDAGLVRRGEVRGWVDQLVGDSSPVRPRPLQMTLAFREREDTPELTIHVPVRHHVSSDADALERASGVLAERDRLRLTQGIHGMAQRPLELGRSLISYVSLRPRAGHLGVTVYLSPELYCIAAPRLSATDRSGIQVNHSFIRELGPSNQNGGCARFGTLMDLIDTHRQALARHPFFAALAGEATLASARVVASRATFFVMAFQDVLKLVRETIEDPALRRFAAEHEREDDGHETWFLRDMEVLGVNCSLVDVFSNELRQARDTAYSQIADVLRSRHDASRLAVVLVLEAASAIFSKAVIGFFEQLELAEELWYFGRAHQAVEEEHEIFEAGNNEMLRAMELDASAYAEALQVIQRAFESMEALFTDVLDHLPVANTG